MPQRLEHFTQQYKTALAEAKQAKTEADRITWLRIAAEWQSLHETLSSDLNLPEVDLSKQ